MICKKKLQPLTREEEENLFYLMDLIEMRGKQKRPTTIRHPARIRTSYDTSDEEQDVIDVQNRIKRLLGIRKE